MGIQARAVRSARRQGDGTWGGCIFTAGGEIGLGREEFLWCGLGSDGLVLRSDGCKLAGSGERRDWVGAGERRGEGGEERRAT